MQMLRVEVVERAELVAQRGDDAVALEGVDVVPEFEGAAKSKRQSEATSHSGSISWKSILSSMGSSNGSCEHVLTVSMSVNGSLGPRAWSRAL